MCKYLSSDFIDTWAETILTFFEQISMSSEEYEKLVYMEGVLENKLTSRTEHIREWYGTAIGFYVNDFLINYAEKEKGLLNIDRTMRYRGMQLDSPRLGASPLGHRWTIPRQLRKQKLDGNISSSFGVEARNKVQEHCAAVKEHLEREEEKGDNYSLAALLYFACVSDSVAKKQYHRLMTLRCSYNEIVETWIPAGSVDALNKMIVERVVKDIGFHFPEFESKAISHDEKSGGGDGKLILGGQCDTVTDTIVWEWKFTVRLTFEHFLQVALYQYLWGKCYPGDIKQFHLLNLATGEHWRLLQSAELNELIETDVIPFLTLK